MQKNKVKFFGMLVLMVLVCIVHYYAVEYIKIQEMQIIENKVVYWWYSRNALDALYYLIMAILLVMLCRIERMALAVEVIFLLIPGLVLLIGSIAPTNLLIRIFAVASYCMPFGAWLAGAFLMRIFSKAK